MITKKFWMVYRENGSTPHKRHMSREAAENEAARLARENPGIPFYILETIDVVRGDVHLSRFNLEEEVETPEQQQIREDLEEIPF